MGIDAWPLQEPVSAMSPLIAFIPAGTFLIGLDPFCLRHRLQSVEWPLHLPLPHPC